MKKSKIASDTSDVSAENDDTDEIEEGREESEPDNSFDYDGDAVVDCVQFDTAPTVLMAFYSGRAGSRGLSVLHFRHLSVVERLNRGSSNVNCAADIGATAALLQAPTACTSYGDILLALTGLVSAAAKLWQFVFDNQAADAANDPSRVTLTLQFVNMYIG
uniref:Uncharacterized protein n=1 Tax=Phytophthora ramorum TaxID=164328 RepID=H3GUP9_PHYRM